MTAVSGLHELSDEEVVKLAAAGDKQAMEHIIVRYKNCVYKNTAKFYMIGYDKDDIIQEGLIALHSAVVNYKEGDASFKTFATLCINRRIVSMLKSTKRQKNIPLNSSLSLDNAYSDDGSNFLIDTIEDAQKENPEFIVIGKESVKEYEEMIKRVLSKLEYDVFNLHIIGKSYKEISDALGKDTKAIDNAVQRIKKKLLNAIGSED